jgi:hypothetical protein
MYRHEAAAGKWIISFAKCQKAPATSAGSLILLKIIGCNRGQLRYTKSCLATRQEETKIFLFQFNCFRSHIDFLLFSPSNFFIVIIFLKSFPRPPPRGRNELQIMRMRERETKAGKTNIIANESASKHLYFNLRRAIASERVLLKKKSCIIEAAWAARKMIHDCKWRISFFGAGEARRRSWARLCSRCSLSGNKAIVGFPRLRLRRRLTSETHVRAGRIK